MIDAIRNWIINICCTLFFITAVEMILPNNSMKKYSKFVLGLILITVIINPILKLVNGNFSTAVFTQSITNSINDQQYQNSFEKYKQQNIDNTLNTFKENLRSACEKSLQDKFPDEKFQVSVDASYDDESETFVLKGLKIGVNQNGGGNFKSSNIQDGSKSVSGNNQVNEQLKTDIITYLSDDLSIDKKIITVFKF